MVAWQVPRVRILKRMQTYRAIPEDSPAYFPSLAIPEGQRPLGVYENLPNAMADCVVITDRALCADRGGRLEEIRFDEMASVTWTPRDKRDANSLEICMHDGSVKYVPVRGRKDKFADVFEFVRFVSRSIADFRLLQAERDSLPPPKAR